MCSISFQNHLAVPWPCSQERGRLGVASTAFFLFLFSKQQLSTHNCSFHLSFSAPKVASVCGEGNQWLIALCQLRDGFQTILCACTGGNK